MTSNIYFCTFGLVLIGIVFISGCIQQDSLYNKEQLNNKIPFGAINKGLGSLCSDEEECNTFCHDNKGRCKDYCDNNPENEVCQKLGFAKSSCETGKIKFDYAPVNLDKTTLLLPLGLMSGGHVTPVDHHYFQNFANEKVDIEIYSPGIGII